MGLKRRATRFAFAVLALLAAWAALDTVRLWHTRHMNVLIAQGTPPPDAPGVPREVLFALAHAQAESGAAQAALNRYGSLQGDTPLGLAARYNSANLLLRQGMKLQAAAQPGQALAHIELAKESYRELLRHDPNDWPARYNLERAQRLVPDPDELDEAPPELNRKAERAATTMRGFLPGLP